MIALAAVAGSGGCDRGKAALRPDAAPEAPARNPAVPESSAASTVAQLRCRAIAADGDVTVESAGDAGATRLANMAEIPGGAWLRLADGARLVAKDPRTTRETTFLGAGRSRPCVDRGEESWIAAGSFESAIGSGESPGAEEWVVTPQAVVRYASARLRVDVTLQGTRVRIANGAAFLWPPRGGAASEGWQRLTAADTTIGAKPSRGEGDAVDRCDSLAERSRALAKALLSPGDSGPEEGRLVAEQVTARRLARAACALASLRVESLTGAEAESERREGLSAKVHAAMAAWRSVPVASSSP